MLALDTTQPTLLGIAAVIAAIGGIISTLLSNRRARREEREKSEEDCLQRLKAARLEAEEAAAELHRRRMEYDK
jgi:hypothetical protein